MSEILRIVMSVACITNLCYVLLKIRKSKFKIEEAVYWISLSVVLLILCFFPELAFSVSNFLGFEASINFVFLIIIFLLIVKSFSLASKVSELEDKLKQLIQMLAIERKEQKDGEH